MSNFDITGEIIVISDTQEFASGFKKREFVIKTSEEKYPQSLKFELVKEACDKLNTLDVGDTVTVAFNLQGNEYNGKFYVNLRAWKITGEGNQEPAPPRQSTQNRAKPPAATTALTDSFSEDDDIPF